VPKVAIAIDRCKGCGLCVAACPKKVLALSSGVLNSKGYHPAEAVDQASCIACAFCGIMCPDACIVVTK
jgi:2-oxoglutarate ferredoxin oxidoreductase subunit delta